jgi:hypothetical protein
MSTFKQCDPPNDDRPGLNFLGLRSVRVAAEPRFNPAKLDPHPVPTSVVTGICSDFPVLAYAAAPAVAGLKADRLPERVSEAFRVCVTHGVGYGPGIVLNALRV